MTFLKHYYKQKYGFKKKDTIDLFQIFQETQNNLN